MKWTDIIISRKVGFHITLVLRWDETNINILIKPSYKKVVVLPFLSENILIVHLCISRNAVWLEANKLIRLHSQLVTESKYPYISLWSRCIMGNVQNDCSSITMYFVASNTVYTLNQIQNSTLKLTLFGLSSACTNQNISFRSQYLKMK